MWLWDTVVLVRVPEPLRKRAFALVGIILTLAAGGLYVATSLPQPPLTTDDLAAMEWLKQNTEPDVLIYNPNDHWTVVLTERNTINTPYTQVEEEAAYDYMVVLTNKYKIIATFEALALEPMFTANEAVVYRVTKTG
jgi:hypothetical protein